MMRVDSAVEVGTLHPEERRGYRTLFLVGCPRSGTTWVQLLLAQHPEIATAPETQIFAYYLVHLQKQWDHEKHGPAAVEQGGAGLSRLLDDRGFEELCRRAAGFVLDRIAATGNDPKIVLEKSPKHALQTEFISRLFPDAAFLHVVRDPRDTAASLIAASKSWGRGWAPSSAVTAARWWREHVVSARAVSNENASRFREIRYEDLRANPVDELGRILEWLAIPLDKPECVAMVDACKLERLQEGTAPTMPTPGSRSPEGFFRKGSVGGWRRELSSGQVAAIEWICRDLMRPLGYAPAGSGAARGRLRVALHDGINRVRESLEWQLTRIAARV